MNKKHPKISKSKKVYNNKYLALWEDYLILDSGRKIIRNRLMMGEGSVIVIAIDKKNNFFMVKQYRHAIKRDSLEFVNGGIKKGETALQAAKRELAEELGFKAKKMKKLLEFNPSNSLMDRVAHVFLATDLHPTVQKQDYYEDITEVKLDKKNLLNYIKRNKIKDMFTISAFLAFLIKNK